MALAQPISQLIPLIVKRAFVAFFVSVIELLLLDSETAVSTKIILAVGFSLQPRFKVSNNASCSVILRVFKALNLG